MIRVKFIVFHTESKKGYQKTSSFPRPDQQTTTIVKFFSPQNSLLSFP